MILKFFTLRKFQLESLSFNFIASSIGKIFIDFFHFYIMLLFLFNFIIMLFNCIWFNEILLHHFLNLFLLFTILPQLILHKSSEFLFFSYFHLPIIYLHAPFIPYLLHMKLKYFLVVHLEVTHENPFAKFMRNLRRMYESQSSFACSIRGRYSCAMIPVLSNPWKFLFTILRIGVCQMNVA